MPKVRFSVSRDDSDYQCLGIDTSEVVAFDLDVDNVLNLWFKGCQDSVPFSEADLGADNFSTLLQFVIDEFPHIDDFKLKSKSKLK